MNVDFPEDFMRLESWSADGFSTTGAKPIRRISQLIVSLLLLVFTLIAVPAVRAVDGITTPPDGGGMQWSKMERALDRNNNQLKWKPYGNDRAAPAKYRKGRIPHPDIGNSPA